uniref:Uncharacterized protein n=1 Tax=Globodera rostochiensis TaxID=31243 RepID=A0A914H818_GLORO
MMQNKVGEIITEEWKQKTNTGWKLLELLENFQRICRGLQSLVGPAVAVIGWTCDCNHWLDLRLQSLVGPVTAIISWTCSDDDDKTCECAAPLEKKGKISQMRSRSFFYPSKT